MNKQSFGLINPPSIQISGTIRFSLLYTAAVLVLCFSSVGVFAQQTEQQKADYQKAIAERAGKIVNNLGIADSVKYKAVQGTIAGQYFNLAKVQDENKAAVDAIKQQQLEKDKETLALKSQEEKKSARLKQLHDGFIAHLKEQLTDVQVDQVKDGMTYRVLPITYAAYLDEIPSLTTDQKAKIYDWLKEARELAMDAESSDKKHAVFGKYKGRINNYLSAAGYDMKKEREEWQKRIKEREAKKKEAAAKS